LGVVMTLHTYLAIGGGVLADGEWLGSQTLFDKEIRPPPNYASPKALASSEWILGG
jgi:hypothetical protein